MIYPWKERLKRHIIDGERIEAEEQAKNSPDNIPLSSIQPSARWHESGGRKLFGSNAAAIWPAIS